MDNQSKRIIGLFSRYLTLILLGLGNLYIFHLVLIPLTVGSANFLLNIFSRTILEGNVIVFKGIAIEIIPACVAGAAFYLLVILAMSTAEIKPLIRTKVIATSIISLFVLNIIRILLLVPFINTPQFTALHWIFWNIISTIIVVAIWIYQVKVYNIKTVPVYSDVKYLAGLIKPRKKSKRSKKN